MAESRDLLKISEKWIRILNKNEEHEKIPRDYGTGDLLHCSEIHTVMAIGKNPEINVTNLSLILGISKSAISQMVSRLERKKLVEKYQNSGNEKTILLRLTPRGNIAFLGHEQHHAKIYAAMHQKLGEITGEELSLIIRFLSAIEETFDECSREDE
ncbi:MarR family winged helix-turn-helix transcriptional regulator [Methanoplanus endosymbiosus]|uniref:MarR family transcriptional regulator n=1 Tax=Methanoplanus endosymbiosus TaxID=33865 RepID=A0A9E7PJP7_9EURY|nr:MarR family transcriptional regulator [Methanoplanus endosymbiosus]UUX91190.1 MarR family transcriptional regulator [Methanoplanus endosymbiosus]